MAENMYEVLWPRGRRALGNVAYGTRLKDLTGKRIAELWNGGFRGDEIFPIIERELSRRYQGIEFVRYDTFGLIHGSDEHKVVASLPEQLKKLHCDAAIVTSGC